MKFKDKVVLITGASRGIGRATALMFAQEGANIVFTYCNSEKEAFKVKDKIEKLGVKVIAIKCDNSEEQEIKNLIKLVEEKFNKIDVLVNNAGNIIRPGDSKTDMETWRKTIDINLTGVWNTIKYSIPYMSESSAIINISSFVGKHGSQYVFPYGVAKAGVVNLTKAYAKELAPKIRVNSVSPGNIDTDMTRGAGEEFINKTINNTPLKRLGKPEEIAQAILFLASGDASFITGVDLDVDGGYLLTN